MSAKKISMAKDHLIISDDDSKMLRSENYNYLFNNKTGFFARWGKTKEDDPITSEFGPEILDIEVTTICANGCPFCYKSNTANGTNMSLDSFKTILNKIPKTLTQVAFGADAGATSNPELFDMMEYCRNNSYNQVVPNITVADITDETADKLAKLCGAVAVSRYSNKNKCYDSVKKLTDSFLKKKIFVRKLTK